MKVICKFNDPLRLPVDFPNNFDYGLEVEKEYLVMGMAYIGMTIIYII